MSTEIHFRQDRNRVFRIRQQLSAFCPFNHRTITVNHSKLRHWLHCGAAVAARAATEPPPASILPTIKQSSVWETTLPSSWFMRLCAFMSKLPCKLLPPKQDSNSTYPLTVVSSIINNNKNGTTPLAVCTLSDVLNTPTQRFQHANASDVNIYSSFIRRPCRTVSCHCIAFDFPV